MSPKFKETRQERMNWAVFKHIFNNQLYAETLDNLNVSVYCMDSCFLLFLNIYLTTITQCCSKSNVKNRQDRRQTSVSVAAMEQQFRQNIIRSSANLKFCVEPFNMTIFTISMMLAG